MRPVHSRFAVDSCTPIAWLTYITRSLHGVLDCLRCGGAGIQAARGSTWGAPLPHICTHISDVQVGWLCMVTRQTSTVLHAMRLNVLPSRPALHNLLLRHLDLLTIPVISPWFQMLRVCRSDLRAAHCCTQHSFAGNFVPAMQLPGACAWPEARLSHHLHTVPTQGEPPGDCILPTENSGVQVHGVAVTRELRVRAQSTSCCMRCLAHTALEVLHLLVWCFQSTVCIVAHVDHINGWNKTYS